VLNFVPRHQEIVASILGADYASILTKTIGVLEILMALWILSGYKSKFCAILQISVVMLMNILELSLVPELLLHGQFNIIFALLFSLLIWYNEFKLNKSQNAYT